MKSHYLHQHHSHKVQLLWRLDLAWEEGKYVLVQVQIEELLLELLLELGAQEEQEEELVAINAIFSILVSLSIRIVPTSSSKTCT